MSKSRVFFFILLAFIVGVFWRSFFSFLPELIFILVILALIVLALNYKNVLIAAVTCAVFSFIFGLWLTDGAIGKTENLQYLGKNIQENAMVEKSSPSTFGQNIILTFPAEKISVLASVPQYPEYAYGDLLQTSCTLKQIENIDPSFDYRMYMAKDGVLYQCDKPKIQKIAEGQGNRLYAGVLKLRDMFVSNIRTVIPEPEGSLAVGLILGGSGGLSKEVQSDFSRTGMTHIVAVSGYNVTIIAEYLVLAGIFLGMWRKQAIWFAIAGIILFVIMSGLPASAVRAGVMGGTLLWAMKHGRLANSQNAIIFAAGVMLMLNPLLLRWDVGFQLSFLATLGIVETSSFWEQSFIKKHKALGISETIALSLSAQIFVLPIIAYNFHMTSLISLLANVFILPIIPFLMLLVFLVSISGFVFGLLSSAFAWLAFVPLKYEIEMIHVLANFPWASMSVESVNPWWVFWYYVILYAGIVYLKRIIKLKLARKELMERNKHYAKLLA